MLFFLLVHLLVCLVEELHQGCLSVILCNTDTDMQDIGHMRAGSFKTFLQLPLIGRCLFIGIRFHKRNELITAHTGADCIMLCSRSGQDCARMSGDEFISLVEADSYEEAAAYQQELEEGLKTACSHMPYVLHISIGIAEYDGQATLMELLNEADKKMYEQKKQHKQKKSNAAS